MNIKERQSWRDISVYWGIALLLILLATGHVFAVDLVLTQATLSPNGKLLVEGSSATGTEKACAVAG